MKKLRLPLLLASLAIAAFGVAACGSDNNDNSSSTTTGTTGTTGASGTTGTSGATGAKEKAASAGKVAVAADPSGQLKYVQSSLSADAGKTTFNFVNASTVPHDFTIEKDGNKVDGTDVISKSKAPLTVTLDAGEYTYYCSVAGHRQAGMEGTLTVK
jgi:plastocyanin